MAGTFSIQLQGLDKLQNSLNEKARSIAKEIDAEIGFATQEAIGFMQSDAPADQGFLRSRISSNKVSDLNWEIISQSDYSGFLEFGTRSKVVIPPGLEDVAAQIKGAAGFSPLEAKEAIFNWCKRHGIDQKLWYPIYISIMTKGIAPHPFFFHNFERIKPQLLANIKNILTIDGL